MKRKAKKAAALRKGQLTTAELKKLYAGLQWADGKISDALDSLESGGSPFNLGILRDANRK